MPATSQYPAVIGALLGVRGGSETEWRQGGTFLSFFAAALGVWTGAGRRGAVRSAAASTNRERGVERGGFARVGEGVVVGGVLRERSAAHSTRCAGPKPERAGAGVGPKNAETKTGASLSFILFLCS